MLNILVTMKENDRPYVDIECSDQSLHMHNLCLYCPSMKDATKY